MNVRQGHEGTVPSWTRVTSRPRERGVLSRRQRSTWVAAIGALVLTAGSLVASASGASKSSTTTTLVPSTFLGPNGVESSAIIAENEKAGSKAWRFTGDRAPGVIEGFAGLNYAADGQVLPLYISSTTPTYRVEAFRMGYYHALGARLIWTSPVETGFVQAACPLTPGINMVSCDNWLRPLEVDLTSAFVPGDYLFKLIGSGNQQSYIPFTIWDPNSAATYLMVARTLTEQGWNDFGGYDYYVGEGPCAAGVPTYPQCNRARVVSFDRPYADGDGASDFLGNEFPLVYWAEENGLDITYVTDVTLTADPSVMYDHSVIMSPGHDETWTNAERVGALTAVELGVNVIFFGAAAVLRHSRLQSSPLGSDREEVDYRDSSEDPLNGVGNAMQVTGNTWSSFPSSWSETILTGQGYSGYGPLTTTFPFVVFDSSSWLFKGTGLKDGSSIPGVIKSDIDHLDLDAATPSDLQVLGHSPLPIDDVTTGQGAWDGYTYSDATYWTDPTSGAGVFDSGTVNWVNAIESCPGDGVCPAPLIQKITGNLLRLFGQGPAGTLEPSVNNLATVNPTGS